MENEIQDLTVRPLTRDDWPVIERLFGPKGACGGCWCMLWRAPYGGQRFEADKGLPNKQAFRKLVTSGEVYGCLAFAGNEPVGWCSIGPRESFPGLQRSRVLQSEWDGGTWSVTCIFVPPRWRGRGVSKALVGGAIELARHAGARELEAYPVVPRSDGTPIPAAFAWTGVPNIFEAVGFREATPDGNRRPIYRRAL